MRRRVEFAETDMAGILHFSNYFRYMEEVEHAFFRSLGHRVHHADGDGFVGWARGSASCHYEAPLHYEDEVELRLRVRAKRRTSVTYEIDFTVAGEDGPRRTAQGTMTAVCVRKDADGGRMRAVTIPGALDALLEVAEAD